MGLVEVDTGFHVQLTNLEDFQRTVSERTWSTVLHYAEDLKERNVKIAFFSATPQGGGVALMRHALVRFSHSLGTDINWWVRYLLADASLHLHEERKTNLACLFLLIFI